MSRAFVKELDDPGGDAPPELKISEHPNLVTKRGLKQIEDRISALNAEADAKPDEATAARLARDLRYWTARAETAQLVERGENETDVTFGSRVKFRRNGGHEETIEIVGEDESDPASGKIGYVAPLADAMLGARTGETVTLENRTPPTEIEILSVESL